MGRNIRDTVDHQSLSDITVALIELREGVACAFETAEVASHERINGAS